jgi:hypothetical protein
MLENKSSGIDFEPRVRNRWAKFGHVVKMYNFARLKALCVRPFSDTLAAGWMKSAADPHSSH